MSSVGQRASAESVAELVEHLQSKGVSLWAEQGQLRYKSPKGALTHGDVESLRISKSEILDFVQSAGAARPQSFSRLQRAPLSFSQLAHWNLCELGTRRTIRHIASATRLSGRLDVDAFRRALAEVMRRHDALRTRVVAFDTEPVQAIAPHADCELAVHDLTDVSPTRHEDAIQQQIEQLILEPIDVAVGPLFAVRLLKLRDDVHVLLMAMAHIIADAFSRNILLRELLTAYAQTLNGHAFRLPPVRIQFSDYAVSQRNASQAWTEKYGAQRYEWLARSPRVRFPESEASLEKNRAVLGTVPIRIGADLKRELREWCRLRHTTLAMGALAIYVALVLRWCKTAQTVIGCQTDGRVRPEFENTIGYFSSTLYLRTQLLEGDTFIELTRRVTQEYCHAYENADVFACLTAHQPQPEFTRNTAFNWVPQRTPMELSDLTHEQAIRCSAIRFVHPLPKHLEAENMQSDREPAMLLYETDDEIVGDVYFSPRRFSVVTMERFGRNYLYLLRELLVRGDSLVSDIPLV